MIIRHKNPAAHGIYVLAARAFHFDHGVAEADLNGAEQAAILARGHTLEDAPVEKPKRAKPPKPTVDADISDPAVEVTEEAPPEIG